MRACPNTHAEYIHFRMQHVHQHVSNYVYIHSEACVSACTDGLPINAATIPAVCSQSRQRYVSKRCQKGFACHVSFPNSVITPTGIYSDGPDDPCGPAEYVKRLNKDARTLKLKCKTLFKSLPGKRSTSCEMEVPPNR